MSHGVAGQKQANAATSVSGGDAQNAFRYTESSITRKRLRGFSCCVTAIFSASQFAMVLTLSVTLP